MTCRRNLRRMCWAVPLVVGGTVFCFQAHVHQLSQADFLLRHLHEMFHQPFLCQNSHANRIHQVFHGPQRIQVISANDLLPQFYSPLGCPSVRPALLLDQIDSARRQVELPGDIATAQSLLPHLKDLPVTLWNLFPHQVASINSRTQVGV